MRALFFAWFTLVLAPFASAQDRQIVPVESGGRRMALVIGNDAYSAMPLRNARNDASAIRNALVEDGFSVDFVQDADRRSLSRAVDAFTARLQPGDVALFYYAGHGLAVDGQNYLLPVDFAARSESDVEFESYPARQVQKKMEERGTRLNIIVLDACRDNPFHFTRSAAGGLAAMREGTGTLIVFSAAEGQRAADTGTDVNSFFTKYLVEGLRQPGISARDLFYQVQERVHDASGGKQTPSIYAALVGSFYFRGGNPASVVHTGAPSASAFDVSATLAEAKRRYNANDLDGAMLLYRKCADAGNAESMRWVGVLSARPGDNVEALPWYRKAADLGDVVSMHNLGMAYLGGGGIPKDFTQALSWFRKAAAAGNALSMWRIGLMYEHGNGVPRDPAAALSWYQKGAAAGEPTAQAAFDRLKNQK